MFRFKHFSVEDKNCAMKIGTDGCLLGAWADVTGANNIMDIGTGSGVIALMLAQLSTAKVDAVEIDNDAYLQACENFDNSPWKERLNCFHSPIQEFVKTCNKKYELIVCCPPYFVNSLKAGDSKRNLARHTDALSFQELLSLSSRLLHPKGGFCTIIPYEIVKNYSDLALIEGLYPVRITDVLPKEDTFPVRTLLQFEQTKNTCKLNKIAILDKGGNAFTDEYMELTKEFYLNF